MGTHDRLLVLSESKEIWDPEGMFLFLIGLSHP